jgi:hypothetical protein
VTGLVEMDSEPPWFAAEQIKWIEPELARAGLERLNIWLPFWW